MGLPKSLKTAFICVMAENKVTKENEYHEHKEGDIVKYTFDDIQNILNEWSKTKSKMTYYAIEHKDEHNGVHFHIVLNFHNVSTPTKQVKNKFPFGKIESCKNIKRCVQYLVHLNNPKKEQYDWKEIVHNDVSGLNRFKPSAEQKPSVKPIDRIVSKISAGDIKEFEVCNYVNPIMYSHNRSLIDNALNYYYQKASSNPERSEEEKIHVIMIQGDTRAGKTDMAKAFCKFNNLSFCLSGASNDMWENYKGEECMILDDIRDCSMSISDMLKMLDPYNNTLIKRRYHNACFVGHYIILTSNEKLHRFYSNVYEESRRALFSRIELIVDFDELEEDIFYLTKYDKAYNAFVKDLTPFRKKLFHTMDNNFVNEIKEYSENNIGYVVREFEIDGVKQKCVGYTGNTNKLYDFFSIYYAGNDIYGYSPFDYHNGKYYYDISGFRIFDNNYDSAYRFMGLHNKYDAVDNTQFKVVYGNDELPSIYDKYGVPTETISKEKFKQLEGSYSGPAYPQNPDDYFH